MPENLIVKFGANKYPRVKAIFKDKIESHISVKSRGDKCYIIVSGSTRKKLGLQITELIQIYLEKEESTYGMPTSDELEKILIH